MKSKSLVVQLLLLLLIVNNSKAQINVEELKTVYDNNGFVDDTKLEELALRNSTVKLKPHSQLYRPSMMDINLAETKDTVELRLLGIPWVDSKFRLEVDYNGSKLVTSLSRYIPYSFSSPLMDSLFAFCLSRVELINAKGVDNESFYDLLKLVEGVDSYFVVDTTFTKSSKIFLKRDLKVNFLGRYGNYYKIEVPGKYDFPIYSRVASMNKKVIEKYQSMVRLLTPSQVQFINNQPKFTSGGRGKLISTFSSGGYRSETRKVGNSWITTSTYNGKTSKSTYTTYY